MNATETSLLAQMKPGTKWRTSFGPKGSKPTLYHVLAIVDDDQVVVKRWANQRQCFLYEVQPIMWFRLVAEGETSQLRRVS